MANHQAENVIFVDTTGASFEGPKYIEKIKYLGASSGTAKIQEESASGKSLWEGDGTTDSVEEICINAKKGIYVTVTNGAKVYIYLK